MVVPYSSACSSLTCKTVNTKRVDSCSTASLARRTKFQSQPDANCDSHSHYYYYYYYYYHSGFYSRLLVFLSCQGSSHVLTALTHSPSAILVRLNNPSEYVCCSNECNLLTQRDTYRGSCFHFHSIYFNSDNEGKCTYIHDVFIIVILIIVTPAQYKATLNPLQTVS